MQLEKISLTQYKNFESQSFAFNQKVNCFVGNNGVGKSNVLDAIYHLAFGKSFFNPSAVQNILFGKDFFVIEGLFHRADRSEKNCVQLKARAKKNH